MVYCLAIPLQDFSVHLHTQSYELSLTLNTCRDFNTRLLPQGWIEQTERVDGTEQRCSPGARFWNGFTEIISVHLLCLVQYSSLPFTSCSFRVFRFMSGFTFIVRLQALPFSSSPVFQFSSFPVLQFSSSPVFQFSSSPVLQLSSFPVFQFSSFPVPQFPSSPVFQFSSSPVLQLSSSPVLQFFSSPVFQFSSSLVLQFSSSPFLQLSSSPVLQFSSSLGLQFSSYKILQLSSFQLFRFQFSSLHFSKGLFLLILSLQFWFPCSTLVEKYDESNCDAVSCY